MSKVKIGFLKVGNIGCNPLAEFLLDERAEREDIEVRVFGSGSKMDPDSCIAVTNAGVGYKPDLMVFMSPNAALPGPTKAREILKASGIPTVVVSDNPAKKAVKAIEEAGIGYIIVEGDVMIGARKEFLDPAEMACFNSDIIKVLAACGAFEVLSSELDKLIAAIKSGAIKHIFLVAGCDGAKPGRNYYTQFVEQVPKDCLVLTLACGKFRFFDKDLGEIGGLPRLLDMGQCTDAYSAIQVAVALSKAFNCGVNDLPLSLVLSWYEQKAAAILLTLFALDIKNIRLGPSLPAFITPNVLNVLVDKYNIKPISTPDADLKAMLA